MSIFGVIKKLILFIASIAVMLFIYKFFYNTAQTFNDYEYKDCIDEIFYKRNMAMLNKDEAKIKGLYDIQKKYGIWAYEHEIKKLKYLKNWEDKQGIKFYNIKSKVIIRWLKKREAGFKCNLIVSTEYQYFYETEPFKISSFRIGTYHSLDMIQKDGIWVIGREWYTDPFADSLNLDNIKAEEIKNYIISMTPIDYKPDKRRAAAVDYADKYCGAAADWNTGYKYNNKYRDYNSQGGDCANFASQILFEGGKFRKNKLWNYNRTGASRAWVNAQGFKDYIVNSNRGSVVAYGSYNKVYKAAYKLKPGDFIAYEKNGRVTHISVITGADTKGYPLVNCHNTDRYRVPWDLGWSDKGIKFWLVHVHF